MSLASLSVLVFIAKALRDKPGAVLMTSDCVRHADSELEFSEKDVSITRFIS